MPTLVLNCPHCSAQKMGFTYRSDYAPPNSQSHFYITASCNGCHRPVTASIRLKSGGAWTPKHLEGDLISKAQLDIGSIWPHNDKVAAPNNVPEKVGRSYVEAVEARQRSGWNAACSMYRRTMELALKAFAPDVEAWKLEKRIDKLAADNKITPDIKAWAHELRLDGNEALHGDEDATQEMTDQMHHLTHFLLVYLYTLPNEVDAARKRRAV